MDTLHEFFTEAVEAVLRIKAYRTDHGDYIFVDHETSNIWRLTANELRERLERAATATTTHQRAKPVNSSGA